MIFKTFNSDSDKFLSKIGILGKSFEQIGTSIRQRKIEIDNLMGAMSKRDAKAEVGGFWSYIFGNESIKEKPIDLSKFVELDEIKASNLLKSLHEIEIASKTNTSVWQEYFSTLSDGQKWQIEFVKNNDLQKTSAEDLVKANQQARASALAHNEAIKAQTLSAKAGSVALKALSVAGNMLAMWAIIKGVQLVVKGIDNLIHSAEHCKERVDELMSSYQSALDKANSNAKTIENLASRYEELSKGVNNLGENVSLTTDEYSEYNKIVNQIADMFPTLVQGYTNEGNAILSLKGNVEQLRDAYKEAQQEAYNMLIASGEGSDGNDIIKNWKNISSKDGFSFIAHTSESEAKDALQHLLDLAESGSVDLFKNIFHGYEKQFSGSFSKVSDAIDRSNWVNMTEEDLKSMIPSIRAYIQTYQAEINSALSNIRIMANAYLMTNEDFALLDEQSKNATSIIVNSINETIASSFDSKEDIGAYVLNIVSKIKNNPEVQDALVGLFTLDASKMQPDEAKVLIDQYISYIADILGEKPAELKIKLGFEDADAVADNYNTVIRKAAQKFSGESFIVNGGSPLYNAEQAALTKFAEENSINTQDEIAFWNKCIEESDTREEAMKKYLSSPGTPYEQQTFFTQLTQSQESLDKFQSSIKSAADAYTTLLSGNYSSDELLDSIQAINQAAMDMGDSLDWEEIGSLDELSNAIEYVSESYVNSVLSGAGIDTDSRFGQMLANVVQEAYKSEAQLSSLNIQIDSLQSAYDSLTDIVSTYNETGHITFDQLQTLLAMEPQYLSCLIDENGQLSLNQGSLLALSNQRLNDAQAQAVQQAITELGQLALQDEKAAVEENALAFNNAVNDLAVYNAELANTISEASVASSVIRDLNAAINNAESKGAPDVQIDTVLNNLNTKLQLIKKTRTGLDKNLGNVIGGKSSSSSKSSATKSEFEESIDFFKQRADYLNDALSLLKANMDNISGSFGKNSLVDAELGITEEKFNNYTDALSMYTQKANEALSKLPADIAAKVRDGAVALTDFVGDGNKDVVEAIKDYESWKDMIAVSELILE